MTLEELQEAEASAVSVAASCRQRIREAHAAVRAASDTLSDAETEVQRVRCEIRAILDARREAYETAACAAGWVYSAAHAGWTHNGHQRDGEYIVFSTVQDACEYDDIEVDIPA